MTRARVRDQRFAAGAVADPIDASLYMGNLLLRQYHGLRISGTVYCPMRQSAGDSCIGRYFFASANASDVTKAAGASPSSVIGPCSNNFNDASSLIRPMKQTIPLSSNPQTVSTV